MEENPFNLIEPDPEEIALNKDFFKSLMQKVKDIHETSHILVIKGPYGIGKSLYLKKITDYFKGKDVDLHYFYLSYDSKNRITEISEEKERSTIIILDWFDLVHGLNEEERMELFKSMIFAVNKKVTIIISSTDKTIKKVLKDVPELEEVISMINVPELNLEEAKRLVLHRLNKHRYEESDSFHPFKKSEIRKAWKVSKGNPRLIIMLLKALYEAKTGIHK